MLRRRLPLLFVVLFSVLATSSNAAIAQRLPPGGAPPPGSGPKDVTGFVRVISGDTIEAYVDGQRTGIGLIGIEAPQANTDCGRQATARLQALVKGGVHLDEDPDQAFDHRIRRMYQVKARDGRDLATELSGAGLVRAVGRGQDKQQVEAAAEDARRAGRGCAVQPVAFDQADEEPLAAISLKVSGDASVAIPVQNAPKSAEAVAAVAAAPAAAAFPSGFTQEILASGGTGGLSIPTAFAFLPDGRILITQQNGVVRIYKDGALLSTPFIDLQDRVNDYWDRGLLGIAVDPNFSTNGHVYLLYVYEDNAADYEGKKSTRLVRYTAPMANGMPADTAPVSSELIVLGSQVGPRSNGLSTGCDGLPAGADCIPAGSPSHSAGSVKFAPDGTIFLTSGDASSFTAVDDNALRVQSLDYLSGKIMHVTTSGAGVPNNPFWNGDASANRSKIWAYGLRNPFRFNLRPGSSTPYIGDVGWNSIEEVNVARAGANLGWPCYEGPAQQGGYASKPLCASLYNAGPSAVDQPLISWNHSFGGPCCSASVTGGAFYSGTGYPAQYQGAYFYADYSKNWIRYLRVDANDNLVANSDAEFATAVDGPVDLEMGPDGNLYYLALGTNQLRRIRFTGGTNQPPNAAPVANPSAGLKPLAVQFTGAGSTDPNGDPITYLWNFGDGSPTSTQPNPQRTYTENGTYVASLTVDDGRGGTDTETVTITVGNAPPTVTVTSPSSSLQYKVGDIITFAGTATDPETGPIAGSQMAWTIFIRHCPGGQCHQHILLSTTGSGGSFTVPDHGDDSYFDIALSATDPAGLTDADQVTIRPQTVHATFASSPAGLNLLYDGVEITAPQIRTTVPGSKHTIEAPDQGNNQFSAWSDDGARQHDITIGATDVSFTATFVQLPSITFDDRPGQNQDLNGQYPTGVIDWGTGVWYHSAPFGAFATKSVSFDASGLTSGIFTFITPRQLVSIQAYNGGVASTTVSLSCAGQPTKTEAISPGQLVTIATGWTGSCGAVTVGSTNGWDTNFDNIVYDDGGAPSDTTPPTVSLRSPADAATGVATNTAVTATFSEDVQGVSGTTFQLKDAGGATVAAAVTYSSATRTATLTPSAALANSATYTATLTGGASAIRDQANNPLATGSWSFTTVAGTPPPTCPCSIWPSSATPAVAAQADPGAVEVGVKLRSDVAGYVTGIRFYKGSGNSGTHVGSLWSSTGTRLANATFTNETATGWQQVSFATPVQIAANTTYVASYSAPVGRYSVTANAFTTAGVDNAPLHALGNGTDGPNGVYKYGPAGTFPDQTYQATNYWVDVVFTTTPPASDTTPPTVSSRLPADAATGVVVGATVTATFSEDVQGVSGTTFQLKDAGGVTVAAAVTYSSTTRTATLTPSAALANSATYTATLTGGASAIRDLANNALATGSWSFTTAAASTTQTVTFDDAAGQNQLLNGQYPTGVINWGNNKWWLSGPYGQFTTKSISFDSGNVTSQTFAFVTARRLVSIQAFNGGTTSSTVTLACSGQTTKSQTVGAGQLVTITTGWTGTCTTITVTSSNGWETNFDNIVHDAG